MVPVDIKSLLRRLNRLCSRALESAAGLCVSRSHYEVAIEHLLLKVVEDPTADVQFILKHVGADPARVQRTLQRVLEDFRSGNPGKPVFSPLLIEWFQESWVIGSIDLNLTEIRSGALVAALAGNPGRYAAGWDELLHEIRVDELKRRFFEITAGSSEEPPVAKAAAGEAGVAARGDGSALGRFTVDFTGRARASEIDPVFGRDREIRQMIEIGRASCRERV